MPWDIRTAMRCSKAAMAGGTSASAVSSSETTAFPMEAEVRQRSSRVTMVEVGRAGYW